MKMNRLITRLTAAAAAAVMCASALPFAAVSAAGALRTVTVTTDGNGTAAASPAVLSEGENYTLTATPSEGYEFDRWEITDDGSGDGVKRANIAFVIDKTGSMSSKISKVKSNLKEFVSAIDSEGIKAKIAVVEYGDVFDDGDDSTVYHTFSDGSHWTENADDVYAALDSIKATGGGDTKETPTDAFSKFLSADGSFEFAGASLNNYIFLLTDAGYKDFEDTAENRSNNRYPMETWIEIFKDNNVKTSVVTAKSVKADYGNLIGETEGTYIDINVKDYYELMLEYAKFISDTVVTVSERYYTNPCTAKMPDCNITAKAFFKPAGSTETYYTVTVVTEGQGEAWASKYTAKAGDIIAVGTRAYEGYLVKSITAGGAELKGGSFVMPAANVTVKVVFEEDLSRLIRVPHSYIFSYDKGMELITVNCNRKYTRGSSTVVVKTDLGAEYAGRSVTLYKGRKSTSSKVDEAVLDGNGRAEFTVPIECNFTLIVEE